MMNNTIQHLENVRAELLRKAVALQKELELRESGKQQIKKILLPDDGNAEDLCNHIQWSRKKIEASQHASGINWGNVTKTWLDDNIYLYKISLVSALLEFKIELKIALQNKTDEYDWEILGIENNFSNFQSCYLNEILPWITKFTDMKNFVFLTYGVSAYNEQALIRAKLLSLLQSENYVILETLETESGGVSASVHPSTNIAKIYMKVHWTIQLIESTLHMGHRFNITPTKVGKIFLKKNPNIIDKFDQTDVTKNDITEMWTDLCNAVDIYEREGIQ